MEKHRVDPISRSQKDLLLGFIKRNPDLQTGRYTAQFTCKKAQSLWQEITEILNAIPEGARKDWRQWRRSWQDQKRHTKAKAVKKKKLSGSTGDGAPSDISNEEEYEILMEPVTVYGQSDIEESSVEFWNEDIDPNLENTVVEDSFIEDFTRANKENNDHTYNMEYITGKETENKKRIKLTKIRRARNSLKISQHLLKIKEEKKLIMENYYREKINYMKRKTKYEKDKLTLLKSSNILKRRILDILVDIRDKL